MTFKRTRLKSALPQAASWGAGQRRQPVEQAAATPGTAASVRTAAGHGATPPLTTTSKRRLQRRLMPLEVLQQPLQAGVRKVFDLRRFILVLLVTSVVLLLPSPPGLGEKGQEALALFVFTGAILALEPAPLPIAALLVPICQVALGIDTAENAFAPFGQPVVFLVLGSLFLAEALRKHGLTRRLAFYAVLMTQGDFRKLLLSLMIIAALLSMWVLNTAIAAVLIPVAITIAQHIQRHEDARRALALLVLSIAYGSSIGGIATVMGSNENAIATGLLNQAAPFGFVDWMLYGVPMAAILLPLSWFVMLLALPIKHVTLDTNPIVREIERMGGLSAPEREILGVLFFSVILWVSGNRLEEWLHLPQTVLNSAVVALSAVALLSIEEIIDWNDLKGVNWGVFFVIGAGLTLGDALNKTGAGQWFASLLAPTLAGLPYPLTLGFLIIVGFTLTQFMNNVTLGAILAPILVNLGEASGILPARLVIPTIFAVALSYTLPVSSARMTLVAVTGAVESKEMIRTGLLIGAPSMVVIWLFFYVIESLGWI